MKPCIEILSPGLYTSIQDRGRIGFRKFGVPRSGAMDRISAAIANTLLNNSIEAALLEITLSGPKILFHTQTIFTITGANLSPQVNGKPISTNTIYNISTGDILSFGKAVWGARCYLTVKGGFKSESILNSFSLYKSITKKGRLEKGDVMATEAYESLGQASNAFLKVDMDHFKTNEIECLKGPEFEMISAQDKKTIFNQEFTISLDNSRMGYRLESTPLTYPKDFSMLTSAVLPGTVQLTPSGKLIALMQDCQTTGGYPRILQLTSKSLSRLAQKKVGDTFRFSSI